MVYFAAQSEVYTRGGLPGLLQREGDVPVPETAALFDQEERGIARRRILHPYLGYGVDRPATMGVGSPNPPLQKRAEGKLLIGITGGSVAGQVRTGLAGVFRDAIEARGLDLEPVVIGLSVDGFKQPQQLQSLAYFLSLGAEFDAVICLDGFNDIVLPYTDNYRLDVYPFYPRSWNWLAARRPSQAAIVAAGETAYLQAEQEALVERGGSSFFGHSALFGLYAHFELRRASARITQIQADLAKEKGELTFESQGPFEEYESLDELYADAAAVWARSSILMHHALAARGAAYLHFLQPNQYVEGSKVLSSEEKRIAYNLGHPYARPAITGYPYLFEASQEILAAGVQFVDATPVFKDERGDIYQDDCCHLNKVGKKILARYIAEHVLDALEL